MDRIIALFVRVAVFVARFAAHIPTLRYDAWQPGKPLRILLVGYNGARNTGADVRVAAIAEQLRKRYGNRAELSVMTLDADSTRPYMDESVRLISFTTIFFRALLVACSSHHVILLSEGSMLKSKFANGLALFMCQAAGIAKAQGKPCIAYGVEAGDMDSYVARLASSLCSDVHFIARTPQSLKVIESLGLHGRLGTDTAWPFDSSRGHDKALELLKQQGWNGSDPLVGMAVINPFCWPARPSLWRTLKAAVTRNWEMHYQKWYFFSWSQARARKFNRYVSQMAMALKKATEAFGAFPVIIGMEQLDKEACLRVAGQIGDSCAVVLSNEWDGYVIGQVLAKLRMLATSRYHAAVLTMMAGVPSVAVSMDERLDNLFASAGLPGILLNHVDDEGLAAEVAGAFEAIEAARSRVCQTVGLYCEQSLKMVDAMGEWLDAYVVQAYPQALEG